MNRATEQAVRQRLDPPGADAFLTRLDRLHRPGARVGQPGGGRIELPAWGFVWLADD